jgi:hypothetical protein
MNYQASIPSPAADPGTAETQSALSLLEAGIPLSLILDLSDLNLAKSKEIARVERADTGWVRAAGAA